MALTTAGRNHIAAAITDEGPPTPFDNTNAHIGVGDSDTAFSAAQTDLVAESNKLRVGMETSFPTTTTNSLVFKSQFETGEANFAWKEVGIFNAASAGTMLSRKVESLGTKTSGVWVLTVTLTVVAA